MKFSNPFRGAGAQRRQAHDHRNVRDKALLRQFQSGSLAALDAFGRPLEIQDDVLYQPPSALIYKIMAAAPILDPQAPPGLLQLTLVCTVPVNVMSGQPTPNLMLVGRYGQALAPVAKPSAPVSPETAQGNGHAEEPQGEVAKKLVLTDSE